jgi:hypothetical protein
MAKQTYLQLDYAEVHEKYPLSVERLIEWFAGREDIVKGISESEGGELNEVQLKQMMGQVVPMIIQHDPRKLYEFFDENKIIIYIGGHPDTTDLFVHHNNRIQISNTASSRGEAEKGAFMDAFGLLEHDLTH